MNLYLILSHLLQRIWSDDQVLQEAIKVLDAQSKDISRLEKRVSELEKLLNRKPTEEVKKDSSNSSLPPSKDIERPKRTKARKETSVRKPGGQPGHKGSCLQMVANPNQRKKYYPSHCSRCSEKLNRSASLLSHSRQEIDLPEIQPIVIQHDSYKIGCSCGCMNVGKLPSRLTARVQYGPRVRAVINYCQVYQYLPYARTQDLLKEFFNLSLSEGTIHNTLSRSAEKSKPLYELIRKSVEKSKVVGCDETVIYVKGVKWYFWVWQTFLGTYIASEDSRRKENIYKHFPEGFPNGILVSDRYSCHLSTPAKGHQLCWSHLVRDLKYILLKEGGVFASGLRTIYDESKTLEGLFLSGASIKDSAVLLENRLDKLLGSSLDTTKYPDSEKLRKSLLNHRDKVLLFMYDKDIPSHNNASELAIRNAKVKMKISGCFRSAQQSYAIIRSVIDTCIKQGLSVFESLLKIEKGKNLGLNL